jgi:monofunctional biosynthetic peptidoglycan transglycosylase
MKFARIFIQSSFIVIACLLPISFATESSENGIKNEIILFDFQQSDQVNNWFVVNDGVMGGLSKSEIVSTGSNTAVFRGTVSLDNNGGFASTRTIPQQYNLAGYNGVIVRLKGDGKKYQFRLRMDDRFDGISYRYPFTTDTDKWIIIRIPFSQCVPVFRGRILDGVEPLSANKIQQIGFLISDKQAGSFKIEIDTIKAYKK